MDDTKTSQPDEWLEVAPLLHDQIAPVIARLRQVDADNRPIASLEDYQQAAETLPPVLNAIKKVPRPKATGLRQSKQAYEGGVDAFIKASDWGVKHCMRPSEDRLANLVYFLGLGTDLLEEAARTIAAHRD